ncbi:uncharacterized protein LOC144098663 [Amblyomma americanum]
MLTPVWFILVAIAIPCQAYLDDRVLLDQHWTGFSPTAEDVRRREDLKALQRGRQHTPQLSDNEPDKRSAGFSARDAGTGQQMVRSTSRSSRERTEESYLRFRAENARNFETAERSVRRILSSLERLSRRERLSSARADVRHTQRAVRVESRRPDLRKQERESRDRRLEGIHERVYAGSERQGTEDAPTWVKEDSRRTVRSHSRDLVRSGDRLTPSQKRRNADERSDIRGRQTDKPDSSRSHVDLPSSNSERHTRFDETRENSRRIDARVEARRLEHRVEKNRLSRSDAVSSTFSGRQVDGKDRGRYIRDAMQQSHLIMDHLNSLIGLAKKLSVRSRVGTVRSTRSTVRHQTRSNGVLLLEALARGDSLARVSLNKGEEARASSGAPGEDSTQTLSVSTVRNGNIEYDKEERRDLRHSERVDSRTRDIRTSLQSSRNREARRSAPDERYAIDTIDRRRIRTARSLTGRTMGNVWDKRYADTQERYSSRRERTQFREDKESRRESQHERASRTRDSRTDERDSNRDVQERRSLSSSVRHADTRTVSTLRARVGADHRIPDRQDTRETSIRVYNARQPTRTCDAALPQTADNRHRLSRLVDSRARAASPSGRHLVREQGFITRDRAPGDDVQRYLHLASQRTESRRERCGESRYQNFRSADFSDMMVADSRMTSDRRRLSYEARENALSVRTDLPDGEPPTSRANRDGATLDRARSTRENEDAAARNAYRRNPEDTKSSRVRDERHRLERRQSDRSDLEDTASNDRRDMTITQLFKTDLSLSRIALRKAPSTEDLGEKQEETSYHSKHQKSALFWDEFTPSHFRTDSSLFRTVLTVGMVAWMTMSPSRKIMD